MYAELERKTCTKCKELKNIKDFSKRSARPIGRASICKECLNEWRREYKTRVQNKYSDYEFKRGLRRFYGITPEDYWGMHEQQQGRCACCGCHGSKFKRKLHVDHDHETGVVRGLLCTECNPGLGYFKHSIERMQKGISYLQKVQELGDKKPLG